MPTPLNDPDPSFEVKYMQQECLKVYINRENILKDNHIKIYGIVWRQCSSALQSVIKGLDEYKSSAADHYLVWLLQQIKKVTSGIDVKAKPHNILYEAISTAFNVKQFPNESNDRYVERFKSNVQTVELVKGGHIFCSRELVQSVSDEDITNEEIEAENEKLKAFIMLRRSDEGSFKKLLNDLKEGAHLGRDE